MGGGGSTQDVYAEIRQGNSERWTIQSQKRKYVNGKLSGVIEVGYTASINNPDYLLEEDKSNNEIQITAFADGNRYKNWKIDMLLMSILLVYTP